MKLRFNKLIAACCLTAVALPAAALEFRSVAPAAAILYDAPSQKGSKQFIIRQYSPVELVVNLEGWAKVRDADGGLAWIEKKDLAETRTVQVTASKAVIRSAPSVDAPMMFEAEHSVALEMLEGLPDGWIKVRPLGGEGEAPGYVRVLQVWGL
jgi:SH3-like domain-containing protein